MLDSWPLYNSDNLNTKYSTYQVMPSWPFLIGRTAVWILSLLHIIPYNIIYLFPNSVKIIFFFSHISNMWYLIYLLTIINYFTLYSGTTCTWSSGCYIILTSIASISHTFLWIILDKTNILIISCPWF